MKLVSSSILLVSLAVLPMAAQAYDGLPSSPKIYSSDGRYLGNLNANRYDANSTSNPYGRYGSRYSEESVNNPYGRYGSRYSPEGASNPYGGGTLGSTLGGGGGIGSTFGRD